MNRLCWWAAGAWKEFRVFLCVAAAILLFWAASGVNIHPSGGLGGRTTDKLRLMYVTIVGYYGEHGSLPVANAQSEEQSTVLLLAKLVQDGLISASIADDWACDAWGRLLHVSIDIGACHVALAGRPINDRLAIWSDGPNGINEFGEGDDVSTTRWGWALMPSER